MTFRRVLFRSLPFDMSFNAVSKHLRVLERAGLVRRRVAGREHLFSFDGNGLAAAADWIGTHHHLWVERLGTLDGFLRHYHTRD